MAFLTHGKVGQQVGIKKGSGAATGTSLTGEWIDASLAPQIAAAVTGAYVASDNTASVQWQEATDSGGTGGTNLGDAQVITGADGLVEGASEINSSAITTGFTHVRAVVTFAETTTTSALIYLLGNQRGV